MSAAFDINIRVKQGCPASPHLFCLFFGRVRGFIAAHALPSHRGHTPYLALLETFVLLYANNVALIAAFPERLQQLLDAYHWLLCRCALDGIS